MAPKGWRGKGKGGERKKKDEKVLPLAVDITVNLPDESHVILKGISTDRVIDVRRLLCVNTLTCNLTNYSLAHEVRGPKLKDTVDITALKPCTLSLMEEEYDEERAVSHVRRLLDLLSATTCFGPAPAPSQRPTSPKDAPPGPSAAKDGRKSGAVGKGGHRKAPIDQQSQTQPPLSPSSPQAEKGSSADLEAEMSAACPRLGAFYEFFSLANLTPPLQFIKRTTNLRQDERPSEDHLFFLEVKLCNGKLVIVEACARGFYSVGKQRVLCHNLVDLLRHLSRAFDNAYEALMKAFLERNKFGNLPYGFRANTWLVPPVAAQSPSVFPPLPAEDETWGGNGGGWGRDGKSDMLPWANEFLYLKSMPCKTAEERQVRDRRAFLIHSLFIDVAILRAVAAVKQVMERKQDTVLLGSDKILHFETVGDFSITVTRDDASVASCKIDTKIDGCRTIGIDAKHLLERNLLKGITADENTAAHDISTLGIVNIRYCGYIAVVKVNHHEKSEVDLPLPSPLIADHPEGGANALNINSLRMLLHKSHAAREKSLCSNLHSSNHEELSSAQAFVEKLLKESLVKLEEEETECSASMRWELGACWIQHLQDQSNGEKDKKQAGEKDKKQTGEKTKSEPRVEGLGKPLKILKNFKKKSDADEEKASAVDRRSSNEMLGERQCVNLSLAEHQAESRELKDMLPESAYARLKESKTGLHMKAYGGNSDSSGLGDLFDNFVGHLTATHCNFLKHWARLIDLEAQASQATKKEMLFSYTSSRNNGAGRLTYSLLNFKNKISGDESVKNGRYIYYFVQNGQNSQEQNDPSVPEMRKLDYSFRCGDFVVLSTETRRVVVASGVIDDVSQSHISVSFPRRLRLPGCHRSSEIVHLTQELWRIEKDEFASSFSMMRFNLIQLFAQSSQSEHLRKMIVDLEVPRFESGGILSQDPALSYIRSEKNLNDDQRRSIQKILAAKDYTLILGMPGTGKTSTMVHAVKALLMRGASILLTSYTNLAIDTLLIKLKSLGINFVRIGRREVVHTDILEHCISEDSIRTVDDIKTKMEHVPVVGVTCLGINHPLLLNKKFDICIMDEAGQTTLPVSLGPLMLASKFVLVGDHYQLPPLVQSAEARENGMCVSLFCRLSEAHPQAISALECQYRMCAGIMELSNALIYGNRLRCGSSVVAGAKLEYSTFEPIALWLQEILCPNRPVIFVNTDMLAATEERDHKTVVNHGEAYIISEITQKLLSGGIAGHDIGIITPYNSQANIIRQLLGAFVEVQTIDKYQGRDKDCILLSFVRSSRNTGSCISSLLGDWHRINVAVTRAKKKLIMVGSCKTLSNVPLLKLLIDKVNEQDGVVHISSKDIPCLEDKKPSLHKVHSCNNHVL